MQAKIFKFSIYFFTFLALGLFGLFVAFLWREAYPFLVQNGLVSFILGSEWDASVDKRFGVFYILCATFYVAALACVVSLFFSLGVAIFLSFYCSVKFKNIAMWFVNMLVGIPSIVYGFFAVVVIVGGFERFLSFSTGECVLAAGLILALMIAPFFILNVTQSFEAIKTRYLKDSDALGVSREFFITKVLFRQSRFAIFVGFILAFSRAIGETMAVMMVIGNAPIAPTLLSKAQSISSLIVLEMPMSEIGSMHYHALFASAFVLLASVLVLNLIFFTLSSRYQKRLASEI